MEIKYQGIYKIRNLLNGKVYIGQSVDLNTRFKDHKKKCRCKTNHPLYNTIRKYGLENFEFDVIEHIEDINKLNECEQYWLDYYKSYDRNYGYNLCYIAESTRGYKHTEETKQKMSLNHSKSWLGKKHTEETKRKIGECHVGKEVSIETRQKLSEINIGKKRKPFTDVHRRNLSLKGKGRKFSKITREKMLLSHTGKKLSEEHRKNLSEAKKGRKHSEETKIKMSKSQKMRLV